MHHEGFEGLKDGVVGPVTPSAEAAVGGSAIVTSSLAVEGGAATGSKGPSAR